MKIFHWFCSSNKRIEESIKVRSDSTSKVSSICDIGNDLLGIWGKNADENAFFEITKDSIYYVDNDQTFPYVFKKGVFTCLNEKQDTIYSCIVTMPSHDSLVMEEKSLDEKATFIRMP